MFHLIIKINYSGNGFMDLDRVKNSYIGWDKLRTFYYVSKAGSFTSASEYLNLSQSAISRQVIDLEARLENKLFNRLARGLVLSRAGEILFKYVENMMISIEEAFIEIDQEGKEPAGKFTIHTASGFANLYLNPYISDFLKCYPKINLSIVGLDIEPDLHLGRSDLLIYPPVSKRAGLIQETLLDFPLKLYASRPYLEKHGVPKSVKDLDQHQLISYGEGCEPFPHVNWILTAGKKDGKKREPYAQVNSVEGRLSLAKNDFGITLLPPRYASLKDSGLVQILPDAKTPCVDFCAIYAAHQKKSKRLQVFLEWFEERCSHY